jgi:hypothetical protein
MRQQKPERRNTDRFCGFLQRRRDLWICLLKAHRHVLKVFFLFEQLLHSFYSMHYFDQAKLK